MSTADRDPAPTMTTRDTDLTPAERKVLDRITPEELVEVTRALLAPTGENPPGGEGPTAAALVEQCRARDLSCSTAEVEPGRPNVSAVLPGGPGPGLLLLGHTDVVPVGQGWTLDPFGGEIRDGRMYGRGATDMLGGLAACVVAMTALRRAEVALAGPVELCAVVDEEETGKGIRHHIAAHPDPAYAGCIVAEPTDLQTIIAARGDSYLQFDLWGQAAHAGNPADGRNAISGAAAVVAELESWHRRLAEQTRHPLVGTPTWSVGQIQGGTGTAIVPAHCRVVADRRLLPDETGPEVLTQTRERMQALGLAERGLGLEVALTMEMPSFETPPGHPLVTTVDTALGAAGGPGLPLAGWTAACDGGFVARAYDVPVLVLGPGSVVSQAHRPDESVGLDELLTAARTYALSAMRLLEG